MISRTTTLYVYSYIIVTSSRTKPSSRCVSVKVARKSMTDTESLARRIFAITSGFHEPRTANVWTLPKKIVDHRLVSVTIVHQSSHNSLSICSPIRVLDNNDAVPYAAVCLGHLELMGRRSSFPVIWNHYACKDKLEQREGSLRIDPIRSHTWIPLRQNPLCLRLATIMFLMQRSEKRASQTESKYYPISLMLSIGRLVLVCKYVSHRVPAWWYDLTYVEG